MSWKEFKEAVEKLGVKDETEIDWIDCGAMLNPQLFEPNQEKKSVAISD